MKTKPRLLKKQFFVLLEILISMGLAVGLLTVALYFYRYASQSDLEMKKLEEKSFASRMIQSRLSKLFFELKAPYFFSLPENGELTIGPSLVFSCKCESRSQLFHGKVLGRLFVDKHKRFMLALWQDQKPHEGSLPGMHLEVLQENVESINFSFLVGEPSPAPGLNPGSFESSWNLADKLQGYPRAIKLVLKGVESMEYAFPLPLCRSAN